MKSGIVALVCSAAMLTFAGGYLLFGPKEAPKPSAYASKEKPESAADAKDAAKDKEKEKEKETTPKEPDALTSTGEFAMPPGGGVWPWPVGGWPDVRALPVSLTQRVDRDNNARSAAVNQIAGKAVVLLWNSGFKKKDSRGTHVVWADLNTGQATHQWQLSDQYFLAFDLHPDGRRFLGRSNGGDQRQRNTLHMWTIAAGDKLPVRTWQPFKDSDTMSTNTLEYDTVRWAGFVGQQHLVTVCGAGSLTLWHVDTLQKVGVFSEAKGYPAVTPDGNRLVFATADSLVLLDPVAGRVVGSRFVGELAKDPVVAFDPSGTRIACGGTGKITILDLKSGRISNAMAAELKFKERHSFELVPCFGWAGDKHFYCDGELFDMDTPIPIWRYQSSNWTSTRGPQLWAVAQGFPDKETALRQFSLPHPAFANRVKEALKQPGLFALRPGDAVRIDVSGVPADQQAEVQSSLEKGAAKVGYVPSASAPVVIQASVDTRGTKERITYTVGGSSIPCSYTDRPARLKIIKNSKVLWTQSSSHSPPYLITFSSKTTVEQYVRDNFGDPDYKLFEQPLPGVIRGDGTKNVLGTSELTATGIRERKY